MTENIFKKQRRGVIYMDDARVFSWDCPKCDQHIMSLYEKQTRSMADFHKKKCSFGKSKVALKLVQKIQEAVEND